MEKRRALARPGFRRPRIAAAALVALAAGVLAAGGGDYAGAQATPPAVYLLDFNNHSRLGGPLLGRQAAAALMAELNDSGEWSIIPGRQVDARIRELGLRPPFDRTDRKRIAEGIGADAVIYGTVEAASIQPDPPRASVRLSVVVEDIRTGTLMAGVIMEGASEAPPGFEGDTRLLLRQAIAGAAAGAGKISGSRRR